MRRLGVGPQNGKKKGKENETARRGNGLPKYETRLRELITKLSWGEGRAIKHMKVRRLCSGDEGWRLEGAKKEYLNKVWVQKGKETNSGCVEMGKKAGGGCIAGLFVNVSNAITEGMGSRGGRENFSPPVTLERSSGGGVE